jgi:hypothetical protein
LVVIISRGRKIRQTGILFAFGYYSYTSPLAPLQPVLAGKLEKLLAGEGRLIERGLKAPSLNSLPLSSLLKNGQLIAPCLRGGQRGRVS